MFWIFRELQKGNKKEKEKMSYARSVCFTCNNYTEQQIEAIKAIDCRYLVFGFEVGESGTPHLQGYIEFNSSLKWSTIHNKLKGCHTEARKSTAKNAAEYCKKDGKFFEKGDISKQGCRGDIEDARDKIKSGEVSVEQIMDENPQFYHQYGRTLKDLEDAKLRKKRRTWMTEGIWYWGPTGVGKSWKAFEDFDEETHYVWEDDKGWQDGYHGQEIVIMNDFRGDIPYNKLLQLVDRYPTKVSRRGREPVPFLAKKLIITSSLPPEEVYRQRNSRDSIEQLYRRFEVIELSQKWSEGNNRASDLTEEGVDERAWLA